MSSGILSVLFLYIQTSQTYDILWFILQSFLTFDTSFSVRFLNSSFVHVHAKQNKATSKVMTFYYVLEYKMFFFNLLFLSFTI